MNNSKLPEDIKEKERVALDNADLLFALKTAKSVLTLKQKNIVLIFRDGVRVYLSEYIDAAIENTERKYS